MESPDSKEKDLDIAGKHWANKEYARSLPIYLKYAEENCTESLCSLGQMYIYGFGVEKNFQKGIEYLTAAAILEDSGAQYHLGLCHENGYGVKKSNLKAMCWHLTACANDNVLATYKLQEFYSKANFFHSKFFDLYYFYYWSIFLKPSD